MAYATAQDMIQRFGEPELAELSPDDDGTLNPVRIETALSDAAAFVDGYVGQVYRLPLRGCAKPSTGGGVEYVAPPQLVRLSCDLARFYLYDDLAPENEVARRYKAALVELDSIAAGKTQLACPWGGEPGDLVASTAQTGDRVQYCFSPRQITDGVMREF